MTAQRPSRRRFSVSPYKESIPIFTCASIFADAIVNMPIRIYDGLDRRKAKEVVSGPAVKLFERPNAVQEQPDFIRTVALQCALGGMTKIRKINRIPATIEKLPKVVNICMKVLPAASAASRPSRFTLSI